ncbi:Ankyrin-3 [Fusarium oxysporum f. sp. albedinis]|nr:Ankyrin-3 [Fusarium oxysporum f. sp. albedinis]
MSITNARLEQIRNFETKISSELDWIRREKERLQEILSIVEGISSSVRNQIIDEAVTRYEGIIRDMKNAIEKKEQSVEKLKKEKLDLEEYERGS